MEEGKKPLVTTSTESRKYTFTLKQLLIAGGVVVVLIVILLVWKSIAANQQDRRHKEQEATLRSEAKSQLMENTKVQLKLMAKPYTWAVRTAMLRSDLAQVNEYANDIVRERNVVSVLIVDTKGTVVSSTNKKFEGKDYRTFGTASYLGVDSATVNNVNDSLLVVASPVMSFNNKLATIIFTYAAPQPAFSNQQ